MFSPNVASRPIGRLELCVEALEDRTTPSLLAAPTHFAITDEPAALAAGHFNGDGYLDLAILRNAADAVAVHFGDGQGGFANTASFSRGGTGSADLAVGDFNGDDVADLAILAGNSARIFLNGGFGGFAAAGQSAVISGATQFVVADFNGDGKEDVVTNGVVDGFGNTGVVLLAGDGAGGLASPVPTVMFGSSVGVGALAPADFDLDGDRDLAFVRTDGDFHVALNNGGGLFTSVIGIGGNSIADVAVADVNGDGKPDVFAAESAGDSRVFINQGSLFGIPVFFGSTVLTGVGPATVVDAGDFNGDGHPDAAFLDPTAGQLKLVVNNGSGVLIRDPDVYATPAGARDLEIGDFNSDGARDIVTANADAGSFSHFRCRFGTSTTIVTATSPVYGQPLTITAQVSPAFASGPETDLTSILPTLGNVSFYAGGFPLGAQPLEFDLSTGTFRASLTVSSLPIGVYGLTATFDGNLFFSSSTSEPLGRAVTQAGTATTLAAPAAAVFGQALTYTATVSALAPGAGTPTGTVSFFDGSAFLGTVGLGAGGTVSIQATPAAVGTRSLTAVYNGDHNFLGSNVAPSSPGTAAVDVGPAGTSLTLASLLNPSAIGQPVTLQVVAAVPAPGAGTPTGTVTITDNGVVLAANVPLVNGVAVYQTTALSAGTHAIHASFAGDASFTASNSNVLDQTVTAPPTPPVPADSLLAVGTGAGAPPEVQVHDARTGELRFGFLAYDPAFLGGVRVAVGDVSGDGVPDIITGAGTGPHVKVFDGATGTEIHSFFAFDPAFGGGVFVAAGDVNDDGRDDIIVGAGDGGAPHVQVFSGHDGSLIRSFFAFDSSFRGGVRVASGDVDGDGVSDIIAGAGPGGGPHVWAFAGRTLDVLASFFAAAPGFSGGIFVAAGDIDGDGRAEIFTGAGAGGGPQVQVFAADGAVRQSFFAFDAATTSGVTVAARDVDDDHKSDIIAAAVTPNGPRVRVLRGYDLADLLELRDLDLGATDSVFVG